MVLNLVKSSLVSMVLVLSSSAFADPGYCEIRQSELSRAKAVMEKNKTLECGESRGLTCHEKDVLLATDAVIIKAHEVFKSAYCSK